MLAQDSHQLSSLSENDIEALSHGVLILSKDGMVQCANTLANDYLNIDFKPPETLFINSLAASVLDIDGVVYQDWFAGIVLPILKGDYIKDPLVGIKHDNLIRWFAVVASESKESDFIVVSLKELSKTMRHHQLLKYQSFVFLSTEEAVVILDHEMKVVTMNPAFIRITGYDESDLEHQLLPIFLSLQENEKLYGEMLANLDRGESWQGEIWDCRKSGDRYSATLNVSKFTYAPDDEACLLIIFSDSTELKLAKERLDFLAFHDTLTYLPNRNMCQIRYQHSLERAARKDRKVALMSIDLDEFKYINDTLGHGIGDYLLKQVAFCIQSIAGRYDIVGRLGGDEFIMILGDLEREEDAAEVAKKISEVIARPFILGEHERFVSVSIGIAIFPDDGVTFEELLRCSNAAMYQAKKLGKNTFDFHKHEVSQQLHRRTQLEQKIRAALDKNQFKLYFQPQVSLENGEVLGAEALLRWFDDDGEFISPVEFVPLLEDLGLIVSVGRWVIDSALEQLNAWAQQGFDLPRVAVNVSAIQLKKDDLFSYICEAVERFDVAPEKLEVEITESVFVDSDEFLSTLDSIQSKGFPLALDDFGTGYSSLSYLMKLPFDKIKLDRSFVLNVPGDKQAEAMVHSLVALAKTLGFEVIAEGVEDVEQLDFLMKHGCDEAQGYFIGRPVPAEELPVLAQTFAENAKWIWERSREQ
ncbi:bifunctional diguanylate cyclase/phosphodiesterase [Pleionea sp. CnH1-48]|uniref:putative bifunctional diguanylate cyclase/phosphodiesterase n=1 Tax=Pleionea sp. CnH1-48 TaxID=2954494 RepID=UPI00209828F5|nr:EAL domain-containing protein [Pleionea sp. CnH1-48]MCO7224854.1 EAL domain-containing protein [Pleionea sp. CnH1-48]